MSGRPRLLDLFCGAGGAARGYQMAGFHVTGVDIKPQPRYSGDVFYESDALDFLRVAGGDYDVIHASPPCQAYSRMRRITHHKTHPELIEPTRAMLRKLDRPSVIENVEYAPLRNYVVLCGTMFGLRVRRHRWFEISPSLPLLTPPCSCKDGVATGRLIGQRLRGPKPTNRRIPPVFKESEKRDAIGVEWMTLLETQDAIPPAYTAFIGAALLASLEVSCAV